MNETLQHYAAGPAAPEALIATLGPSELDQSVAAGSWTAREIVHHIADGDDIWAVALKAAPGGQGLTFNQSWYDNHNRWATTLDYANRPVEPALALLRARRAQVVELLRHLPDAWDSSILFRFDDDDLGQQVTTGQIIAMQVHHLTTHLDEIRAILEPARTNPRPA
ncbi:MAG: DinB family protein [Vicinamibacterales bacterium]